MRSGDPVFDFLQSNGWGSAQRQPLTGDASARRYERLIGPPTSAILMIMPQGAAGTTQDFLDATVWLRGHGFSAPEILAVDESCRFVLLEDLGDDLLLRLCEDDVSREVSLYQVAIDVLADLHSQPIALDGDKWSPPLYSVDILLREAKLALEWYLRAPPEPAVVAEYGTLLAQCLAAITSHAPVAVHRDYHAENLIWLPARSGRKRIGMIDYQDMLVGHPAYDVVSLLEDARRDVPPSLKATLTARYVEKMGLDPESFRYAAHLLSAQRNLKILGIFSRLCRRDGKPRYLGHLPRVWRYLQTDLAHPELAALRNLVLRTLPPPDQAIISGFTTSSV